MTKAFNTLIDLTKITNAYKTNNFPNAYCLLWNKEQNVELLASERGDYIFQENRKGIGLNGSTELNLY